MTLNCDHFAANRLTKGRAVLLSLMYIQQFPLIQVPDRGMKKQSRESSGGTRKKEEEGGEISTQKTTGAGT